MKKEKEEMKVIFEDDCMIVMEHNGRRIVKFPSEMKGKFNVELESEEKSNSPQFSVSSKLENSSIDIKSQIPVVISSVPILTVQDGMKIIVNNIHHVKIENFRDSLEAKSEEQQLVVGLFSQGNLISLPEDKVLAVHLSEKDQPDKVGNAQACLSFCEITRANYSCNVRSNLELFVDATPKVTLMEGFNKQPIVAEKANGKNAGYFDYVSGPFGKITKVEDGVSWKYRIESSQCLDIIDPMLLQVSHEDFSFDYNINSGLNLSLNNLVPFVFASKYSENKLSFTVDKSNGFSIKSYKDQLRVFSCSYHSVGDVLVLSAPLFDIDSYLKTKKTDFSLRGVDEQKLNFVLKSSRNDIYIKSDIGAEKNQFHINLDGLMQMLTVRGDKVMSSNINMNVRGCDNYVEAIVVSEDQDNGSTFTVDQSHGKTTTSTT